MHPFFRAFKKCRAAPACINTSSNDAPASTSETAAGITTTLASVSTASPFFFKERKHNMYCSISVVFYKLVSEVFF